MLIKLLEPERFHELPVEVNPALSIVAVKEDPETHEIKAFWVAQLQVHVEPVWLAPDERDGGFTALRLFAALLAGFNSLGVKEFYAFADQPEIANYLERLGMSLTPYVTYKGVTPECPSQSQPQSSEG